MKKDIEVMDKRLTEAKVIFETNTKRTITEKDGQID
jgi:hypothetical protein